MKDLDFLKKSLEFEKDFQS